MKSSVLSDTRYLAVFIAIAFSLVYTRAFENEFFKQIILVSIPSILALVGSGLITDRWQIQKTKIELKKEILSSFRKSLKHRLILLDTFTFKVTRNYSTNQNRTRLSNTGQIDLDFLILPSDIAKQPLQMFGKEHENIKTEIEKTRFDSSEFLSLLRLYYKNKQIETDYQDIAHRLKNLELVVEELISSIDIIPFKKHVKNFINEIAILKTQIINFENNLSETPLNLPKY